MEGHVGTLPKMIVGEAPGRNEDEVGKPFVGQAGQLLTGTIKAAGYSRDQVYITNIVKCRPPGNRAPNHSEIDACLSYLVKEIQVYEIEHLLLLGNVAAQTVLGCRETITEVRGTWFTQSGLDVLATFHPAYINRKGIHSDEYRLFLKDVTTFLMKEGCETSDG
jgi:DNA polymerase